MLNNFMSEREMPAVEVGDQQESEQNNDAELRSIFGDYIERVCESGGSFNASRDAFHSDAEIFIAHAVGEEQNALGGRLVKKYRGAISLFLEELINFVNKKRKSDDKDECGKLEEFIARTHDDLFSWSPNIANHAGMDNLFRLGALATRVPEAQGWFGSNMVGELVYELSFSGDKAVDYILEKWKGRPISEILDAINFLQNIGAHAIANGEWAERGVKKVEQILEKLKEMYPCAFVDYAVDGAMARLDSELDNPTVSVLQYHGDRANGRLVENTDRQLANEASVLRSRFAPDVTIPPGGKMSRVASDTVAVFDHANTAQYYGYSEKQANEDRLDARSRLLNLADTFSDFKLDRLVGEDNFGVVTQVISQDILPEYSGIDPTNVEMLSQEWSEISDFYSLEEWRVLLDYFVSGESSSHRYEADALKLLQRIQTNWKDFFEDVKRQIFVWRKEAEAQRRPVKFAEYDDLPKDADLNPFGNQDTDLPLLLQHLHNPAMRKRIEDDLEISLRELPLRAQIHLLEFLAEPRSDRFERLQKVLQKHPEAGNDILLSFLSCAEDKSYGEAVLTLAETLPTDIAKRVFTKYAEIVGTTEDITGYIREQFGKDADEAEVLKTTQNILHRGNELLKRSFERAAASDDLMNQLEEIQSDTVLFASSFKTLFKNKEAVDFSEVRGLDFQRQPISWLSDQDKSEMLSIAKANWSPRGKAGEGVISEFGETLKHGKDIDFYVLRRDGKIISFVRFDAPTPDGHRYAGSFNVDQQYRGSAIGEAMIYNALDKQAEKYVLDATVYPKLDVGTKYVEQTGFAITNVLHNYDNSGEDFFKITCDRRKNKNFVSREARKETLMALASTDGEAWQKLVGQNLIVLKFDTEKEHERVLQVTEGLISEGYIGARYFTDPADKKKRFYVFEFDKTKEQAMPMAATA